MADTFANKSGGSDETASDIIQLYKTVSGGRTNWESHWQEIAERMWPAQYTAFQSNGFQQTRGEKRNRELFDSTAQIALNRFGAILDSLLTPRNQTWHRLKASVPKLNKDRDVQLWFEEVNRRLFKYRYTPKANFASQNQQIYKGLGAFGNGVMFVDQLYGEPGIRYKSVHLSEIFFVENHQGMVDTAIRHFPLTYKQAVKKWGEDRLPKEMVDKAKDKPETETWFLHCVRPNADMDPSKADYRGMPFSSYYVAMEGQKTLSVGGYQTFPYAVGRYEQAPNETYGRSPAMDVLPAIKVLNEQKKTVLKQGHRTVDPVLLSHDDGVVDTFSLKPGAMNAGGVSAEGRPLVQALPVGNIAIGKELMDDERFVINDAFLVTLFQILVETPTMTATEVMERTREKGILLAPTIGRQQSEYLGPMIERELDLLMQQGLLPPIPDALLEAEGEYSIEYDSPLSRAQRAEEAAGLMRSVESALNIVNVTQDPSPLDHFNWDTIMPEISEIHGVPTKWLNSMEAVKELRQQRQEQMQAQQAMQAAPGMASMLKAADDVAKSE